MNWKNHMEQWHDHEYHKMSEEEIFLKWL
jgi:hypothetical protein